MFVWNNPWLRQSHVAYPPKPSSRNQGRVQAANRGNGVRRSPRAISVRSGKAFTPASAVSIRPLTMESLRSVGLLPEPGAIGPIVDRGFGAQPLEQPERAVLRDEPRDFATGIVQVAKDDRPGRTGLDARRLIVR